MRLKNIITYLLIVFVFLLHNMDTIKLMLKAANYTSNLTIVNFAEEEEEHKGSEKSSKKRNNVFFEDHLLQQKLFFLSSLSRFGSNRNVDFSSADYSLEIYCPPEVA